MQHKKISVILIITLIISIAAALSGCTNNTASPTATPSGSGLASGLPATMDYSIKVTGGNTPVTLTYADLRAMNLSDLKDVSVENSVGTVTSGNYIGVPLMDIVNKAGLPAGDVSYRAVASDGYKYDYTADQIKSGILALKTDGNPNTNGFNDKYPISFVMGNVKKEAWIKMPVEIIIMAGSTEPKALTISGANVTSKPSFTLSELKNMTQKTITATESNGHNITVTGVSLAALLDKAGPKGDYVNFISGDAGDHNMTVTKSDIYNSSDAIVAIDENGLLRNIIPGQPSNTWVTNLTRIRID